MTDRSYPSRRPSGEPAPRVMPTREGRVQIEILSIGNDLLRGEVPDANAPAIAARLVRHGAEVRRITVIDDDRKKIASAVREALERSPGMVVLSGGLGPATDDRTLEGVADTLGQPLTMNHQARTMVEKAYRRYESTKQVSSAGLDVDREKPCLIPVGSVPIENAEGIAPGVLCRLSGGTLVLCLPGRPEEMRSVLTAALPQLAELLPRTHIARRRIEAPTPDESRLRSIVNKLSAEYPTMWITSRPPSSRKKGSKATIVLEAAAATRADAESAVGAAQQRLFALATGAI